MFTHYPQETVKENWNLLTELSGYCRSLMIQNKHNKSCRISQFFISRSLKYPNEFSKKFTVEKISFTCAHKWHFKFSNILDNWISHSAQQRKVKTLFSDYLIAVGKYYKKKEKRKKNIKCLNKRYWIFNYYLIGIHVLCCLLDSNSFDTVFGWSLRFKFVDHSNGLGLSLFSFLLENKHDSVTEISAVASLLKQCSGQYSVLI